MLAPEEIAWFAAYHARVRETLAPLVDAPTRDWLLTATTLLRSWGLTLWTFWQNADQLSIYGKQANTLVDNAGVIQIFGVPNYRMAQDLANVIGGISADELLRMPRDEQVLLIDSKLQRCKQVRYYEDQMFRKAG